MLRSTHILREPRSRLIQQSGLVLRPGDIRAFLNASGDVEAQLSVARDLAASLDGSATVEVALAVLHDLTADLTASASVSCTLDPLDPVSDYIAYYNMDADASAEPDQTGTYNDINWVTYGSGITYEAGVIGLAARNTSTNQYGTAASFPTLVTYRSVAVWAKIFDLTPSGGSSAVIHQQAGITIAYSGTTGKFYVYALGNTASVAFYYEILSNDAIFNEGNWQHMAVVHDGDLTPTGTFVIYFDGSDVTSSFTRVAGGETISLATNTLTALKYGTAGSVVNNAAIDELRYYNRALSSTEVADLAAYTG